MKRFLAILLLIVAACSGSDGDTASRFEGVEYAAPLAKPDFDLVTTSGENYDFGSETDGKLTILYFGYTYCPDICPVHLAQLDAVFEKLPEVRRNSVVLFVTVDPERDTPDRLEQWVGGFNPDFVALTGTTEQLAAAQEAVGVAVAFKVGEDDDYTMAHAGQVFAYAPDGFAYTVYPFGTRQTEWVHDLPLLLEMTG
ncbi:MAG: SCO family protein [Acidimicrobiia bacterium]|nr:SCO family protein [Acidimicrobiia bacterium]